MGYPPAPEQADLESAMPEDVAFGRVLGGQRDLLTSMARVPERCCWFGEAPWAHCKVGVPLKAQLGASLV